MKVCVVGSGRCGTRYLANVLQDSGLDATHEPEPHIYYHTVKWSQGLVSYGETVDAIRSRRPQSPYESNCHMYSFIPQLQDIFPDVRFVFLHRDGRECVRSMARLRTSNPDVIPGRTTWRGFRCDGVTSFIHCCRWWSRTNRYILNSFTNFDADWFEVTFEDLIDNNLENLSHWLKAEVDGSDTEPVNTTMGRSYTMPPHEQWNYTHRIQFANECRDVMSRLGYYVDWQRWIEDGEKYAGVEYTKDTLQDGELVMDEFTEE